jgi:alkylation response protein AidB-like acyl-CoA dehydrogenase
MDVRLSSEQQALRDSAARVVDQLGLRAVGELDDSQRAAKLDAAVAAAGWREIRTAKDDGTPWASAVEAAIVGEELGRRLADTAFLGPTLAAELRRLAGAPPSISIETIALAPGLARLASGIDGRLPEGAVAIDASGARSALVLVPARDGHDVHHLAEVTLSDARILVDLTRPSVALGSPVTVTVLAENPRPLTTEDVERWTALGLAMTCADLVGTMRGVIELTREYATVRRQFGVAIGSFQAVQHMLADAFVAMEGSRSVALHAAWAVDALRPDDALAAAAVAKAYCARAARSVCETAIQVHGGIGNTWECLAHVYLRRALLSSDVLGGAGPSLARIVEHHGIGGRNEFR